MKDIHSALPYEKGRSYTAYFPENTEEAFKSHWPPDMGGVIPITLFEEKGTVFILFINSLTSNTSLRTHDAVPPRMHLNLFHRILLFA
jgi:hypothetical protein